MWGFLLVTCSDKIKEQVHVLIFLAA